VLVPFVLLADSVHYRAHTFPFIPNRQEEGKPSLQDWVGVFRASLPQFHRMALADPSVPHPGCQAAAGRFVAEYEHVLQGVEANPTRSLPGFEPDTVNCVSLAAVRERCLKGQGFEDCYRAVKGKETELALLHLPQLLRELDAMGDGRARWEAVVRGVIAGNIFDLGAVSSSDIYTSGQMPTFKETCATLQPRPWAEDGLDALLDALTAAPGSPFQKAVVFCDNAGADIILGIVPFVRELIQGGTAVVMAANEEPCINDCTARELQAWLHEAAESDQILGRALAEGTLSVASTGTGNCVIDLAQVSPELNDAAADADFVVMEGMGRGIETNLRARFKVAALKIGMIKHREVAAELGGQLFGCVCRFDP